METLVYDKTGSDVQCRMCSHYCRIKPGSRGRCRVRENRDGHLVSLVSGRIVARSVDPIEKKPIFHLSPGSLSYSIAGVGCNFTCTFCQNARIAQPAPGQNISEQGIWVAPETLVSEAVASGCQSISYTYTEPTVFFELALATARLAKEKQLYNIFVTNGFMSDEALDLILPCLSAANVDLKAFDDAFYKKYCGARLAPVKRNIERMKAAGVLVELTTLLIPGLNDSNASLSGMAAYIAGTLGRETPWHISRFHPCHKMTDRPATPQAALENAWHIGKKYGLKYVYLGNVPGSGHEHTRCSSCNTILIQRHGYRTRLLMQDGGQCPECGTYCSGLF